MFQRNTETVMSTRESVQDNTSQQYTAETTVIKIPMVRPNPGLLNVIHLNGGKGEVFTMQEVTHHVIQYIKDRALYDPNNVAVVHCGGDPLGTALNVNTFTRNEALGLIWKNCIPLQDSALHIQRHAVSQETSRPNRQESERNTLSSLAASNACSEQKLVSQPSVSQSADTSSSASTPLTAPSYSHKAAKATVIIHDSEIEKCFSDSMVSSSDESLYSRAKHPKRRRTSSSTSINVQIDEPDRAGGSWECQVVFEANTDNTNTQNDTVVVEYDSDSFSVEYEVESSSDNSPMDGPLEVSGESDVSSSAAKDAALVIVCETDVEYLADYSDSDNESETELTEADKWCCEYCKLKNPPFQRNCGGCWSVRPDWLPQVSNNSTDETCAPSQDSITTEDASCSQNSNLNPTPSLKMQDCPSSDSESKQDIEVDGEGCTEKNNSDLCVICYSRRKTASLVHGKTGHQACCYKCAKKLKKQRRPCPICRKPIQKVIRNFNV
ncbi:E3 ubiquitin-protein ligase Mdm2-like isoform X1 [Biomphalaria glabrata]|uniref:E3 ubiquitin-protein ligase Mdm2-like isoform X1 n=2 Tax=Biomphalaria glabrata TaxID=6526 RepID=A0A9W3AQG4_BIOGL|nr:E3 ubiquitin-protein ligase Mdm2-like isoform X1 [Biomphalaria glabrata]KAI8791381.1 E3 ubiquitin-protein ligase Mdm2 isoform X1 [Biomphalaria glabrata]